MSSEEVSRNATSGATPWTDSLRAADRDRDTGGLMPPRTDAFVVWLH
jgi:hypothetical protein